METVKTATGKEFSCDYFVASFAYNQVNIRILDASLARVAMIFSDPKETCFLQYGSEKVSNHTKVKAIIPEGDAIRVVLERG